MLERLNREQTEIIVKLREKEKLENVLKKNKEALTDNARKLKELADIMEKEGRDLKKLESLSLTGLFYTILGSKEEQLDKERQEFLAAKLRYDEAQKSVNDLEEAVSKLTSELSAYVGIEQQYERVMKEKESYILEHGDENSRQLMSLIEKLAGLKAGSKELEEAISAGNTVKESVKHLVASLESAGNWGTWDMLGGGFIVTAVKYSKIDEAEDHFHTVQQLLRKFKHELEDVDTNIDLNVNVGSFEAFADYFLDGLIFDWIVQSRIEDSLNNAVKLEADIDNIMRVLKRNLYELEEKRQAVEKEKNSLIEKI